MDHSKKIKSDVQKCNKLLESLEKKVNTDLTDADKVKLYMDIKYWKGVMDGLCIALGRIGKEEDE